VQQVAWNAQVCAVARQCGGASVHRRRAHRVATKVDDGVAGLRLPETDHHVAERSVAARDVERQVVPHVGHPFGAILGELARDAGNGEGVGVGGGSRDENQGEDGVHDEKV